MYNGTLKLQSVVQLGLRGDPSGIRNVKEVPSRSQHVGRDTTSMKCETPAKYLHAHGACESHSVTPRSAVLQHTILMTNRYIMPSELTSDG